MDNYTKVLTSIENVEGTSLFFHNALKRIFNANDKSLQLPLDTLYKFISFRVKEQGSDVVEFQDDVTYRKDFRLLVKLLKRLNVVCVFTMSIDSYLKYGSELLDNTLFSIKLIVPTNNYEIYKKVQSNTELSQEEFEEALNNLVPDAKIWVKTPLITYNISSVYELLDYLSSKKIYTTLYIPECFSYNESALNPIFPSVKEIRELFEMLYLLNAPRDSIIVENIPRCLFDMDAFPAVINFMQLPFKGVMLSPEGVYDGNVLRSKLYTLTHECEMCELCGHCQGKPIHYVV